MFKGTVKEKWADLKKGSRFTGLVIALLGVMKLLNDLGKTSHDYDDQSLKSGTKNGDYRVSQLGTTSTIFAQDASYFRVREIGLYYTFDTKNWKYVKGLRLGVSANNWFTVTN